MTARAATDLRSGLPGPGRLVLWLAKPLCLVLDVDSYLLERRQVLPAVVGAEEQLTRVGEQDADVRLGAAPIAQIESGQRLSGGDSSSHVAFLISCLRLLRPAGSGLAGLSGSVTVPVKRTLGGRGSCPGEDNFLTAQHNTYPGVRLPVAGPCTPQAKTAQATPPAGLASAVLGDHTTVRVVTGEIPVRFEWCIPLNVRHEHF